MTFNGGRLRIGRLFQTWSQRDLADQVAISPTLVADFERGKREPRGDVLAALGVVLGVDTDFFFQHGEDEFLEEEANFRRRITASERLRRKVLAQASLFGIAVRYLGQYVRFPRFNIPSIPAQSIEHIEDIALQCREHWGLGDGPIASMTRVLEHAGVILLQADCETAAKVDAFSRFGDISVVVLNTEKGSTSRSFFDAAHELGHGVLHSSLNDLPLEQKEEEADRFASAFLLPRESFTIDFFESGRRDWAFLFELKRRWGVSLQAIVYRSYQLGLMDAAEYRTRFRYIARRGWRTAEPDEPEEDVPELFQLAIDKYEHDTGKTSGDMVRELHWSPTMFRAITGLTAKDPTTDGLFHLDTFRQRRAASA